jgi:hypothetical protein
MMILHLIPTSIYHQHQIHHNIILSTSQLISQAPKYHKYYQSKMCIATYKANRQSLTKKILPALKVKVGRKRPLRSLRFSESVATIQTARASSSFHNHDNNDVMIVSSVGDNSTNTSSQWYKRSDLAEFKREARDHLLRRSVSDETRGYERYSLERATNKKVAIRCILLAYQNKMGQEAVASIASQCSEGFVVSAFEQGCKDYCEAYHPDLIHLVPKVSDPSEIMMGKLSACPSSPSLTSTLQPLGQQMQVREVIANTVS